MPIKKKAKRLLPKRVRTLLTAIVVDDVGQPKHSRKEEIADHEENFTGFCKPLSLDVYTPASSSPGSFKSGTDLVLYDFGCVGDTTHNPLGNARHLIRWAQENSSALVVVVSKVTFTNYVEPEMRALGLLDNEEVFNITLWKHGRDPIPDWFKREHGIKGLS